MSGSKSTKRPRVVVQEHLFGGVDVITLYGEGAHVRGNLRHHGTARAAGADVGLAVAQERAERVSIAEEDSLATCPRCRAGGLVEADFGRRTVRGRIVRQSWCRRCRAGAPASANRGPLP